MVWNDEKIMEWGQTGGVTPFDAGLVNPASLDLRIGEYVSFPNVDNEYIVRYGDKEAMKKLWGVPEKYRALVIHPGDPVLMASHEKITIPDDACGMLFSKSTFGRCLIEHAHAGWIDPGFSGTVTFEFFHVGKMKIWIEPLDRVVQLVICNLTSPAVKSYRETGRYQGQVLPTAPKGW